jgi:hypothetical protein
MQRLYEWHWKRDGRPDFVLRNRAGLPTLKRAAARLGGEVVRVNKGFRMTLKEIGMSAEDAALFETPGVEG